MRNLKSLSYFLLLAALSGLPGFKSFAQIPFTATQMQQLCMGNQQHFITGMKAYKGFIEDSSAHTATKSEFNTVVQDPLITVNGTYNKSGYTDIIVVGKFTDGDIKTFIGQLTDIGFSEITDDVDSLKRRQRFEGKGWELLLIPKYGRYSIAMFSLGTNQVLHPADGPLAKYDEEAMSFSYPAYWEQKPTDPKDGAEFKLDKNCTFLVWHNYEYDDLVKFAISIEKMFRDEGKQTVSEPLVVGGMYAIRTVVKSTQKGGDALDVYFSYKDVTPGGYEGKSITTVGYAGLIKDLGDIEPQCITAINSLHFKTKQYQYRNFYTFNYPWVSKITQSPDKVVNIATNCPISGHGDLIFCFVIVEANLDKGETVNDLVKTKLKEFKKESYKNIQASDVEVGGKPGKQISYQTKSGLTHKEIYVMHKGSLFWMQISPRPESEAAYLATVDIIMNSLKFTD